MEQKPWYEQNFEKRLKTVKEYKETFDQYYKKHIPHLKEIQPEEYSDKKILKLGDKGHEIIVQEIVNMSDSTFFMIEVYEDKEKKKVGYMNKDNPIDYLAICQARTDRIYLVPFLPFQLAWVKKFKDWAYLYELKEVNNTVYLEIPSSIVLTEIQIQSHGKI